MIWQPLLFSLAIAVAFTFFIVMLFGWRRPSAPADEGALLSGVFFFLVMFFALWAGSVWLRPWGPELLGVPILSLVVFATVMALLLIAAATPATRSMYASNPGSRRQPKFVTAADSDEPRPDPSGSSATVDARSEASFGVIEGFGMLFWVLVSILLIVAVFGSASAT